MNSLNSYVDINTDESIYCETLLPLSVHLGGPKGPTLVPNQYLIESFDLSYDHKYLHLM